MRTQLAELTWPIVPSYPLVLVPVGSTEQHGPHLPLDTDTTIAAAVANGVAHRVERALVAPSISYGSSGEHQVFAGTISIGQAALHHVVIELVRALTTWARRVVLVNGHGGNSSCLSAAVAQLINEQHSVAWVPAGPQDADLHAGHTETSLMLYLRPAAVRLEHAERGNTASLTDILPILRRSGVAAVSPNGVLGDPSRATRAHGRRLLKKMVDDVTRRVSQGGPDAHGMLALGGSKDPDLAR